MSVIEDIAAERQRQIEQEGWTAEHDDSHSTGTLAVAGACYALVGVSHISGEHETWRERYAHAAQALWPWDREWWKPKDARRDLVRAAALIVAEIERLDRAAKP